MTPPNGIARGREAFTKHRWRDAYDALVASDSEQPLDTPDLERLAQAAYLAGRDVESTDLLVRNHQTCIARQNPAGAARSAFWLAVAFLNRNDIVQANGWVERGRRLLDDGPLDCVERGYLLVPDALRMVRSGETAAAEEMFAKAAAIGVRFDERDLVNLARHGQGRALIAQGRVPNGLALLDEVMVAVTAGDLSPIIAGVVYCSVISACLDLYDLQRAHAWTEALSGWCGAQPDLVPYRGFCQIHRAEVMQWHGAWADAIVQAQLAYDRLSEVAHGFGCGAALYQLAELHRLRGELDLAEQNYRAASEAGRTPHPGLALLWLAQGRHDAAKSAVTRLLDEKQGPRARTALLAAACTIMIACGSVDAAVSSAGELSEIAGKLDSAVLRAMAAYASGDASLAAGNARAAAADLRTAVALWTELDVPYETARSRVLLGEACTALGDAGSGRLELDAARGTFRALGAVRDLGHLDDERRPGTPHAEATGITPRELGVLKLVASGRTNRAIARELGISEKTVARHLSNIFTKLDLTSRAAATAYAFQHGLV